MSCCGTRSASSKHIRKRLGELFSLDYDLLLYDVTSTYFEGQVLRNPQARRGHSRDHRPDCKQVCIALVVTREGIPLGYEVFAGNRVDVITVEEIVETMEARYGLANRIWVMDGGMTSADNVAWLKRTGRRYLIGTAMSELKRFSREIVEARDWKTVREGIEAGSAKARTVPKPSSCAALSSARRRSGPCMTALRCASRRA